MEHDSEKISEYLTGLRGDRKRSDIVNRSDLHYTHVKRIEEGQQTDMRISSIVRFAEAYEVSPIDILVNAIDITPEQVVLWANARANLTSPPDTTLLSVVAKLAPDVELSVKNLTMEVKQAVAVLIRQSDAISSGISRNERTAESLVLLGEQLAGVAARLDKVGSQASSGLSGRLDDLEARLATLATENALLKQRLDAKPD